MGDFEAIGLHAPEPLTVQHKTEKFDCGVPGLNDWVQQLAHHNQQENYTRTFVVRDHDMNVRAYYALCTGMLLRQEAPKKLAGHGAPKELPIALLARIAIDRSLQGNGLGRALVGSALRTAASASQAVAFRAVVVDALDEKAAGFYRQLGFSPTRIHPLKLAMPVQDILETLMAD